LNLARKKQILAAVLIGFTLWPLAQLALVRRFKISPWKLAGWGMYSTPRISPGIGILVQRGNEEPAPMAVVPENVRVACVKFSSSRRLWLRHLAPPDAIGQLVLASDASYRRATIFLFEPVLDTATGMVRAEETQYHYQR
jgi:hypothetical protein